MYRKHPYVNVQYVEIALIHNTIDRNKGGRHMCKAKSAFSQGYAKIARVNYRCAAFFPRARQYIHIGYMELIITGSG